MEEIEMESSISSGLGWRHILSFFFFLCMTLSHSFIGLMSVAIVAMRNSTSYSDFPQYDWDSSTSNMILGAFFYGNVLSQLPAGQLVKNGSTTKILFFNMFISSILTLLLPWVAEYGYAAVICIRAVLGFSQGFVIPCTYTFISRWIPPTERARLGTFIVNGFALGTILGLSVSGYLADSRFGWPGIFYFFGIIGIIWSVLFYCISSDYPKAHSRISSEEAQYINASLNNCVQSDEDMVSKVPWKAIMTSGPVWANIIASCGNIWGFNTFLTQLPTYMKYILHYDVMKSGVFSSLPYIALWLMGFPISSLSDYAISRNMSVTCVRRIFATVGLWIPAVGIMILGFIKTANEIIIVGILIISIGFNSSACSSLMINPVDLSPNFAGPVISFINLISTIVSLGVPSLCEFIITDETNEVQWNVIFYVTAGVYFFSNLIYIMFGKGNVQFWNSPLKT